MAFDAGILRAVVREIESTCMDGRIDKIYQPAAEEIIIQVHCGREKYRLYL